MRLLRICLRETLGVALRLAAYVGVLAALAFGAARALPMLQAAATPPAATAAWIPLERTHPDFAMDVPGLADRNPDYVVLRAADGGGRKDVMTFEADGRLAVIEVYRPGGELIAFAEPARAIAATVSGHGRVEAMTPAAPIETKFGSVALADFTLIDGEWRRGCLGFARTVTEPRMQIAGWICKSGPGIVARPVVACALDRLTQLGGNERKLAEFFSRAELNAGFCGRQKLRHGTQGAVADWIDAPRGPGLRGEAATPDRLSPGGRDGYTGAEYRLRMRSL